MCLKDNFVMSLIRNKKQPSIGLRWFISKSVKDGGAVGVTTNNYLYIRPAWLVRSFNNDPGCGKYKKVISLGV